MAKFPIFLALATVSVAVMSGDNPDYVCFGGPKSFNCTPREDKYATGYTPKNREEFCAEEKRRLENAKNDWKMTVTSVRKAEARYEKTGCQEQGDQ